MLKTTLLNPEFNINIINHVKNSKWEEKVESIWQDENKKTGNKLFNSKIISVQLANAFEITCYAAEYRYFIAQRIQPELYSQLQIRPLAVSGLLQCADGFVFGRRARDLSQDKGLWELVPSGGIEADTIIDCQHSILKELHEEVGIASKDITFIKPFCLVEDTESHVIDIGIIMHTKLGFNSILQNYNKLQNVEYSEVTVIHPAEIADFVRNHSETMVNVSKALLDILPF